MPTTPPHSISSHHLNTLLPFDYQLLHLSSQNHLQLSPNYHKFYTHYPRQYIAHKLPPSSSQPFPIDGNIDKPAWQSVPFSEIFGDITGVDDDDSNPLAPPPSCPTKMKMLYDDTHLYVAAVAQYKKTSSFSGEVVATYTERNSPIYQEDSDFEIFVDVPGCNHDYKEWEGNAINTVWNLLLDKPYDDGGSEHSGRVTSPMNNPADPMYWDVADQRTAVRILEGDVNVPPSDDNETILVAYEVALAFSDLESGYDAATKTKYFPPREGHLWRINFSRVEEKGRLNWVWSPQIVWDPIKKTFEGKVAMHLPDAWGYVQFGGPIVVVDDDNNAAPPLSSSSSSSKIRLDPLFPARLVAMNVYYAQRAYFKTHECYALRLEDLKGLLYDDEEEEEDNYFWETFDVTIEARDDDDDATKGYFVTVFLKGKDEILLRLREDRLLIVGGEQSFL